MVMMIKILMVIMIKMVMVMMMIFSDYNSLLEKVNGKEGNGVHPTKRVDDEKHLKKFNFSIKIFRGSK